jgi:hypothetical protein
LPKRWAERTVDEVAAVTRRLVDSLVTSATPRDREQWAARAKARGAARFRETKSAG